MAVVEVICKNLKNNPSCPHGPTLKFVKQQNGSSLEFFACSTYRDRKDCGFYLPVEEKQTEQMQKVWLLERQRVLPSVDHAGLETRLKDVKRAPPKERLYCHTCGQLDLVSSMRHAGHNVQTIIGDIMLKFPSQVLKMKEVSKKEAQYLFAACTTKMIVENLQQAGVSRVLCLGTPKIHEHIQGGSGDLTSLLLDLDHRYHSFWPIDRFVWFNMFNRHFLSEQSELSKNSLRRFLKGRGNIALVMDPPFGGHIDPLVATVKYFMKLVAKNNENGLLVIWAFPYFRERHITKKCPSLAMLDYKVQYENHKDFNNGTKGRKLGSPVRLFTNMDLNRFVLPQSEGYRFCSPCNRWVADENKHCIKCNSCSSKDGRTYVHCDKCKQCVKPHWKHCNHCHKCQPLAHLCSHDVEQSVSKGTIEPRHKRMKKMKQSFKSEISKKKCKSNRN